MLIQRLVINQSFLTYKKSQSRERICNYIFSTKLINDSQIKLSQQKKPSNNSGIHIRLSHQIFNSSMVNMYKALVTSDVMSKFIQGMENNQELFFKHNIVQFNLGYIFVDEINGIRKLVIYLAQRCSYSFVKGISMFVEWKSQIWDLEHGGSIQLAL